MATNAADDSSALPPLVVASTDTLRFGIRPNEDAKCSFTLESMFGERLAFKIKTNNASRYYVKPNAGFLKPREKLDVSIRFEAVPQISDAILSGSDRFLVQTVRVPPRVDPAKVWDHVSKVDIITVKLKAVCYEDVPQKLSSPMKPSENGAHSDTADRIISVVADSATEPIVEQPTADSKTSGGSTPSGLLRTGSLDFESDTRGASQKDMQADLNDSTPITREPTLLRTTTARGAEQSSAFELESLKQSVDNINLQLNAVTLDMSNLSRSIHALNIEQARAKDDIQAVSERSEQVSSLCVALDSLEGKHAALQNNLFAFIAEARPTLQQQDPSSDGSPTNGTMDDMTKILKSELDLSKERISCLETSIQEMSEKLMSDSQVIEPARGANPELETELLSLKEHVSRLAEDISGLSVKTAAETGVDHVPHVSAAMAILASLFVLFVSFLLRRFNL